MASQNRNSNDAGHQSDGTILFWSKTMGAMFPSLAVAGIVAFVSTSNNDHDEVVRLAQQQAVINKDLERISSDFRAYRDAASRRTRDLERDTIELRGRCDYGVQRIESLERKIGE